MRRFKLNHNFATVPNLLSLNGRLFPLSLKNMMYVTLRQSTINFCFSPVTHVNQTAYIPNPLVIAGSLPVSARISRLPVKDKSRSKTTFPIFSIVIAQFS